MVKNFAPFFHPPAEPGKNRLAKVLHFLSWPFSGGLPFPAEKENAGQINQIQSRAILEWVDFTPATPEPTEAAPAGEAKPAEGASPETKPESK